MDHLSEIREMALNFFQYVYESLKKEDNCKWKISEHGRTIPCPAVVNGIYFTSMLEIRFLNSDRPRCSFLEGGRYCFFSSSAGLYPGKESSRKL